MVTMVLPGTPISYYGDEIGMSDLRIGGDKRNPARTPMQWDTSSNAGKLIEKRAHLNLCSKDKSKTLTLSASRFVHTRSRNSTLKEQGNVSVSVLN